MLQDYVPTNTDVLMARLKTIGITETEFETNAMKWRLFDVGGARSERKKRIHAFENVTTILFVVNLAEYDETLFEDDTCNKMQESLTLFDSIINSRWFLRTNVFLQLSNIENFKTKLQTSPLKNYFLDYTGGSDADIALDYIRERFVSLKQGNNNLYTHSADATDTPAMRFVFEAIEKHLVMNFSRA